MKNENVNTELQEEIIETVKELLDYYEPGYVENLLPTILEKSEL